MIIGLTGGIGSGKSLVADIFELLGIPVYKSDLRARKLMQTDQGLSNQLRAMFGDEIFNGGTLDRKSIAAKVFNDKDLLKQLNAAVHPAVAHDFSIWAAGALEKGPYVLKETAILFEAGLDRSVDASVLVIAPTDVRIARVMKRDKISREQVEARMANQWEDTKTIPLADFLVVNDGHHPLIRQILEIHNLLLRLRSRRRSISDKT